MKNRIIFLFTKQRLVFHKTTAYFSQNDVLFFTKRRVVFHKMTCRFLYANGRQKKQGENGSEWIVKRTIITLSHACARTRSIKRFCIFAVTSVTVPYVNIFVSTPCLCYGIFFNNKAIRVLYIRLTCQQKSRFVLLHFAKFLSLSSPISSLGVTLVTAKKQHRCWNARATHTREENAQCDSSLFLVSLLCLLLLDSARIPSYNPTILISLIIKLDINTK